MRYSIHHLLDMSRVKLTIYCLFLESERIVLSLTASIQTQPSSGSSIPILMLLIA